MKDNETLLNNQIYARLYQEILKLDLEPSKQFFDMKYCSATFSSECKNLYSPKRCIDIEENVVKQHFILHFIKEKGYMPIQYKMWLTND